MTNGTEQTTGWAHALAHQSKEIFCHYFFPQTITRHTAEDVENQVPPSLTTTTTISVCATFPACPVLRTRFHWHLHRTKRVITSSHSLWWLISMRMYRTSCNRNGAGIPTWSLESPVQRNGHQQSFDLEYSRVQILAEVPNCLSKYIDVRYLK